MTMGKRTKSDQIWRQSKGVEGRNQRSESEGSHHIAHVSGIHSVRSVLKHGASRIKNLWYDSQRRDKRLYEVLNEAKQLGILLQPVDRKYLDDLVQGANHQGVVAEAAAPVALNEQDLDRLLKAINGAPLLLVLDSVQDPHNLGACLRTADATGVHAVIVPKDKSVGLTPAVCKVASGAAETVPFVQVTNLVRTLKKLQETFGIWLIGTADDAKLGLYDIDLKGPLAFIVGGEGKGLRRLTSEQCDQQVSMPMLGAVESLNVSVATGVCLYEALRQRRT